MKRRTVVLLVAAVVAAVGIVVGSLAVFSVGGGNPVPPTGEETILRIEPEEQEVSCGRKLVTIRVFLDDLESRPSSRQAGVSNGFAGFQFLLRYDPQIVRIDADEGVELNLGLNQEDPDGDGLKRSFFPLTDIDNFTGEALLGGVGQVVGGSGADNFEEGPDPVAKGSPLLLMTLRFQTVGYGTTALILRDPAGTRGPIFEEPQVADALGANYEPLIVREASLTVTGGDCPPAPPATPRPTPTAAPTFAAPPTIGIPPTPAPVTPVPAVEDGRADCPQGWAAYSDPDGYFSICYPPEWVAISGPSLHPDFGTGFTLRSVKAPEAPPGTVSVSLYWERTNALDLGLTTERCYAALVVGEDVQEVTLTLDGRSVLACVSEGVDYGDPPAEEGPLVRRTRAEIPLGPGEGYLVFSLTEALGGSATFREALPAMLDSLRLGK